MAQLGPSQARDRLKQLMTSHTERLPIYGTIGTRIISELHELFDEYLAKELDEIYEEIQILEGLGDELVEEKEEFERLKRRFSEINEKLAKHYEELKKPNPPDLNWSLGLNAWKLVGDVNDLRGKVGRWTRREIRDYDRLVAILDEQLKRRGVSNH